MTIKLSGVRAVGNGGDGIRIEGDVDLEANDIYTANNGGQGINILKHAGIMQQFGLPKDTDPKELADLLLSIRNAPANEKTDAIKGSSLWGKFAIGALNTTTLISNLINIAGSPQAMQLISTLMK
ncbi:hypothetical protein [Vibrio alginolyticus]|uniref:hypothetical protein n=1 Tax=Vibrio alginolyticus TaxID=663 RepID=UPI001BD46329|nr:hypothetical protein [Vibrio alginolyticus]EGQ9235439.1 hypothetical protein [Vibrio alginolyticus]MBS9958281.1 hypothetical protein [Vibrio alginolyticus]MCR9560864.1 hypothetical protein [Vibrio alginolyticus]MCZ6399053.1 hypothetical protein [Vibrio alginolyticus]